MFGSLAGAKSENCVPAEAGASFFGDPGHRKTSRVRLCFSECIHYFWAIGKSTLSENNLRAVVQAQGFFGMSNLSSRL